MPWGLKRFQEARCLHFVTFSCYRRAPLLGTARARDIFEQTFEQTRQWYGFYVSGYVVMPEHVHLPISFADERTGTGKAFRGAANAQAECGAPLALAGGRSVVAAAILRLHITISMFGARPSGSRSCVTCTEIRGPQQARFWLAGVESGEARSGAESGGLGVEQFSPLSFRR